MVASLHRARRASRRVRTVSFHPALAVTTIHRCLVSRFVCFAPTAPSLPQAVYAYFEPTPKALAAAGGPAGRAELAGEADANRWGLYYGVKHLARENDEAKFFWAFLDESHGEDYVAFFLHCLSTLEKVAGDVVTKQFSSTFAAADYGALDAKVAAHYEAIAAEERKKAAQEEEGGEGSPAASAVKAPAPPAIGGGLVKDVPPPPPEDEEGGQQVVWAELAHACEAVEAILVNAKLPARRKAITQTKSLAVGADGRIDRWGSSAMQCVDVAVWLRVMMNAYKDEQVHRKVRRNRLAVVNNDVAQKDRSRLVAATSLTPVIPYGDHHRPPHCTARRPCASCSRRRSLAPWRLRRRSTGRTPCSRGGRSRTSSRPRPSRRRSTCRSASRSRARSGPA